ncbi:MAG: hypothetical protein J5879_03690 [Clostridia bacterium]|nr:hypothetical protein [Clostridia bacterium]
MKKIIAIALTVVMAAALCMNASAVLNIDRIYVNHNELDGGLDVKDSSEINIKEGDKLYTLGWAVNLATSSNMKEIVYCIDDGEDVKCPENYKDRDDVATALKIPAALGVHAGFGYNKIADGGMFELAGIDKLSVGSYTLTIKAIYNDGTVETKDYFLTVNPVTAAEKDPDTWLCKAGGSVSTGWWMNPFTDRDWEINCSFYTPNAFDGFIATFFANEDKGATVIINLLDEFGEILDSTSYTQVSNGMATVKFSKAYAAGNYTIQFKNTSEGSHFVLGSSEAGDIPVYVTGNALTTEYTLQAPIILLTGAVPPSGGQQEEEHFGVEDFSGMAFDMYAVAGAVISSAGNVNALVLNEMPVYTKNQQNPGMDIVGFLGWSELRGLKIKGYSYSIDGKASVTDPTFMSKVFDPQFDRTAELTAAGFPNGEGFWIVFPYNDLSAGNHLVTFYAIDEQNREHPMFTYEFKVIDEVGQLNITVEGGSDKITVRAGSTVDVKVKLTNNPGISSLRAILNWSDKLTLTNIKYDVTDKIGTEYYANVPDDYDAIKNSFCLNVVVPDGKIEGDGTFATLTFKAETNVREDEFLQITADIDPEDVFVRVGKNLLNVGFEAVNGGVYATTAGIQRGDVNGDGKINNKDVVALFRYVSSGATDADPAIYDFTEDGKINNKDVVSLFRYVSSN